MKNINQILDEQIRVYEMLGRTDIDQLLSMKLAIEKELDEQLIDAVTNEDFAVSCFLSEFLESETLEKNELESDLIRKYGEPSNE